MTASNKQRAAALRQHFNDSKPEPLRVIHAAGLHEFLPKMNGWDVAASNFAEDEMLNEIDKRRQASPQQDIETAKNTTSYALRSFALAKAKRNAARLDKSARLTEVAAQDLQKSKRQIERYMKDGANLLPNLVQAIAGGPYDNPANVKILAALPIEQQWAFAVEAQRRRLEDEIRHRIFGDGRLRKLNHAELDALDEIASNNSTTRRQLAALPRDKAVKTIADMIRRAHSIGPRTPVCDRLGAAFDMATQADRAAFLSMHGLQYASLTAGDGQ